VVAETLGGGHAYAFADPDAFFSCDTPSCVAPWLTGSGLIAWAITDDQVDRSRFSDRLIAACSPACLASALHVRGRGRRWSEPMGAAAFLDVLRGSLSLDPETTPIGEFAAD
jgi:hypothetical protein